MEEADDKVDAAFAAERAARRTIRQQLEVANGELRIHYKATPAVAEQFLLRGVSRKKKPAGGDGEPK